MHRRAGIVYRLSLIGILRNSGLMLAGRLQQGDTSTAAILGGLVIFVGTSLWLAWSSIRRKHDVAMLAGAVFRVLASLNLAAGALIVALFAASRAGRRRQQSC